MTAQPSVTMSLARQLASHVAAVRFQDLPAAADEGGEAMHARYLGGRLGGHGFARLP